jgi:TRAP-type C4-dicarboxylate transport system permease small subunit
MLPISAQKVVTIAVDLVLSAFGAVMLVAGITLMRFGWATLLPMLHLPESVRTLAITSCGGLVFLFAGARAVLRILTFSQWQPTPDRREI